VRWSSADSIRSSRGRLASTYPFVTITRPRTCKTGAPKRELEWGAYADPQGPTVNEGPAGSPRPGRET
jgi:hypothetical protein